MSWFPHFLNIGPALLAAAIAIPSLLVLYFLKLRRQEQMVASTLLWKKAIQDLQVNAPFQRLRRNLLLLLQLLLLALLCLALSRPVANFKTGAGKVTVILVDRSGSMSAKEADYGGRTRLDEAKKRAKELTETMSRDDMATVIAFDDSAETVCPFTRDGVRLRNAIDSIQPTDRPTRLKLAYQLAEAQATFNENQLRASPDQKPDVFLFSDGRAEDSAELTLSGQLHYDRIGTDKAGNVAIVAFSARRNYERPTEVQVFARLANYGSEPAQADVQLYIDGKLNNVAAGERAAYLLPERWDDPQREAYEQSHPERPARDSIQFDKIELTRSAVIRIEQMHKEGDALEADDTAQVVVPPPKSLSVLVVTRGGNPFLEKVVRSQDLKTTDFMVPTGYEDKKPTTYDVIIFDRYKPKWRPPAGNLVFFGVVPDGLKIKPILREGTGEPVIDREIYVLDWKRDHPILEHLSLSKLYIGQALKMKVPLEDETLIEGTQGPLAAIERDPHTTNLVFSFDLLESNWPLRDSFPIFFYNMLQYLAVGSDMDVRQSYRPGVTLRIPRSNVWRADSQLKEIKLDGPDGQKIVKVPETGDFVLPALNHVGLYTLEPPVPQYERIAVNLLDASESNLVPVEKPPGGIGQNDSASLNGKSRVELWWWIAAFGVIPLLMVEWWVYTRRMHL